jgi:hypothetical protein
MCPTPEMVKLLSAVIGGGFILYGTYSIVTGTHQDSDDGPIEQHAHPVQFWLHVGSVYLSLASVTAWEPPHRFAMDMGGQVYLSIRLNLYGDGGEDVDRDEPLWRG